MLPNNGRCSGNQEPKGRANIICTGTSTFIILTTDYIALCSKTFHIYYLPLLLQDLRKLHIMIYVDV